MSRFLAAVKTMALLIYPGLPQSGVIGAGRVEGRSTDFYLGPILPVLESEGDIYRILQALHEEVGASAVFSDWPGTTTYYANCVGLP